MRRTMLSILLVSVALPVAAQEEPSFWKHDWVFEIGIGSGVSHVVPDTTGDRSQSGLSMRVGVDKGLSRRFMLGVEVVGVLRQGGLPDTTGTHSDLFLLNNALTGVWRPFGNDTGPGTLRMRAGVGLAVAKHEYTAGGEVQSSTTDNGVGYIAGLDYVLHIGSELAIGLNATYSYLDIGSTLVDRAQILSTTLSINWIPNR